MLVWLYDGVRYNITRYQDITDRLREDPVKKKMFYRISMVAMRDSGVGAENTSQIQCSRDCRVHAEPMSNV